MGADPCRAAQQTLYVLVLLRRADRRQVAVVNLAARVLRLGPRFEVILFKKPPFSVPGVRTSAVSSSKFEALETWAFPLDLSGFEST